MIAFLYIVSIQSTHKIIDDIVPLSGGNIVAMFYVESADGSGTTCIGDGLIRTNQEISNNANDTSNAVVSSPDYSAIIGNELTILWHSIRNVDGEYQVIGRIEPVKPNTVETVTIYSTFEDMKSASVPEGTTISTNGFYSEGDGGAAQYIVSSAASQLNIPNISTRLSNGLYANLIYEDSINVRQIGAKGDSLTDDYDYFNSIALSGINLYIPNGTYYCSTKLLLTKDIAIRGESTENTVIIYKNEVNRANFETWNQRGLITFNNNNLILENLSFKYIADNSTLFTRTKTQSGAEAAEGVLFSVLRGDSINVSNCDFYVGGTANPSITCMWIKSETKDARNIKIDNCSFFNDTSSTVGGCLWMSAHDNEKTSVSGVSVTNCSFTKRNNDEALSFWGYNINDVVIDNNQFEFIGSGVQNDVLVAFGMPNSNRAESLTNIHFRNNNIKFNGDVANVLKAQLLTDSSTIEIANNTIIGTLSNSKFSLSCFGMNKCGNITLKGNRINIAGGGELSYIIYGGGAITDSNNTFSTQDCNRTMLIKSTNSKYFEGANITLTNDSFNFAGSSTVSEQAVIQYPASGSLIIDNCEFDSSKCAIHELRYQILYNSDKEYSPNSIDFVNSTFDGTLIFRLSQHSNTSLDLSNSSVNAMSFINTNNSTCLSELNISGTSYERIRQNYKLVNANSLSNICDTLTTE